MKNITDIEFRDIAKTFKDYSLVPSDIFACNLKAAFSIKELPGAIVECGVWKGGMMAGIARLLGADRNYYLFDSFEGMPPCQEIDGRWANHWRSQPPSAGNLYHWTADISDARKSMEMALDNDLSKVKLIKGWFAETVPENEIDEPIALLRLDGDWYESTMTCLDILFPKVADGGIIIIDDYPNFDGCSRAVHDYLSKNKRTEKICQLDNLVFHIVKRSSQIDFRRFKAPPSPENA